MTTYEPESEFLRRLPFFQKKGVYVDLGCAGPVNRSLTHFVRSLEWYGVAIDGNPDYQEEWIAAGYKHHFHAAILSDQPTARFAIHENSFTSRLSPDASNDRPELWGINRIVEWGEIVPLNQILEAKGIRKIDLLVLDLEGAEFQVLRTLCFERHMPEYIVSEYVTHGEGIDPRVFQFLVGEKGYEAIYMNESNVIYRRKS